MMNENKILYLVSGVTFILFMSLFYLAIKGIYQCADNCKPYAVYTGSGSKRCVCDTRFIVVGENG